MTGFSYSNQENKKKTRKQNEIEQTEKEIITIDLDKYNGNHIVPRTNAQIEMEMMQQIKREVRTPYIHLTADTINHIGEMITRNTNYEFQNTFLSANHPQLLTSVDNRDDIQFLFQGTNSAAQIGHWICIRYSNNKVGIYDSLNQSYLTTGNKQAVAKLYPNIDMCQTYTTRCNLMWSICMYICNYISIGSRPS